MLRTGSMGREPKGVVRIARKLLEERHGGVDHLRADAVTRQHSDFEDTGSDGSSHKVLRGS